MVNRLRAPLAIRFLLLLALPVLILVFWSFNFYIKSSLPRENGEFYVSGISKDIKVSRDEYGVVHIDAATDEDVFFAMGYVHAQDRLWQLELQRRISKGRLAEVFGEEAIASDVWMRTIGIYDSALASKQHLGINARKSLQAYANGINEWLAQGEKLPIEFSVFDIGFEKWKIEHSLAWQKMFALNLASNYQHELLRHVGRQYQSEFVFETIFEINKNSYSKEDKNDLSISGIGELINLQSNIERNLGVGGKYVGSNAFVVSGAHTKSGLPMLANDPHLTVQIPSLWYAVSQNGGELKSQGFGLVGLPVVIFGKNENIAWGGTNMMADVQDLVVEITNPDNPQQYQNKHKWDYFERKIEKIQVKAPFPSFLRAPFKPVEFIVRKTINGPVISDVVPGFDSAVSLKWVALADQDASYESFLLANYASNLSEFRNSFSDYVAPALNLIYADNKNNIAMLGVGRVPIRAKGDGTIPQSPVVDGKQWQGFIPYKNMPFELNPKSGFIVNANNANVKVDYPYFISSGFAPGYRANRISELLVNKLKNNETLSLEDFINIISDVKDLSAQKLLNLLVKIEPETEKQSKAFEYLRNWNFESSEEQVAPSIFYGWVRHIKNSALSVKTISSWNQQIHDQYMKNISDITTEEHLVTLLLYNTKWCQSGLDEKSKGCRKTILNSLDRALEELVELRGNKMNNWNWGKIQTSVYAHTPFSNIDSINSLFERKYSSGGSVNTVNVSVGSFDSSKGYIKNFGATFRQIIELSNVNENHYLMNSTGQSGQIGSKHYDDMFVPFQNVSMHSIENNEIVSSFLLRLKEL